jgi:hypothetical protein
MEVIDCYYAISAESPAVTRTVVDGLDRLKHPLIGYLNEGGLRDQIRDN